MWNELIHGALGAVVLLDPRRFQDCFAALDFFEKTSVPFVVAVNQFDAAPYHTAEEIRDALAIGDHVPVLGCDARSGESVREVLVALVEYVLAIRERRVITGRASEDSHANRAPPIKTGTSIATGAAPLPGH
jgi:signal recognition particle receptor subunit beta